MSEYSPQLRSALTDTLALVATKFADLKNGTDASKWAPHSIVRTLLDGAKAERWVSLSPQLPDLAEAAPEGFLEAIERLLLNTDEVAAIFAEEGKGFLGGVNPMTGVLWALECLAWSPDHLPRVTLILGGFDAADHGGPGGNRAKQSLVSIFLPWFPQTTANVPKRIASLLALSREYPATAWAVYIALLPGATAASSGTYRPKWREFVPTEQIEVKRNEYFDQVAQYAKQIVELAGADDARLVQLVAALENFPNEAFADACALLARASVSLDGAETRYEIWRSLQRLAKRHSRFPQAEWSMDESKIASIIKLAASFQPPALDKQYIPLFSLSNYDLFEDEEAWESRQERIQEAQASAAAEISSESGWAGLEAFLPQVENAFALGWAVSRANLNEVSSEALQNIADDLAPKSVEFVAGYVTEGHVTGKRSLDGIDFVGWKSLAVATVLANVRTAASDVWKKAESLLGIDKGLYWQRAEPQIFDDSTDLHHIVNEFIEVGRPMAAVTAIFFHWWSKKHVDPTDAVKALLAAASTNEGVGSMDGYHIVELIQALQQPGIADPDELSKVEWAYLELLARPDTASPATLERKLADDAGFFCEVVRAIFRSEYAPSSPIAPSEAAQRLAVNAYRLLSEWKLPPGTAVNGTFDGAQFIIWLQNVINECKRTGHLTVALHKVGPVLVSAPADPSGFWIDIQVAQQLNRPDLEDLRSGYRTGIFNARGVHWVDPTGAPELELAEKYRAQAESADALGYARLAGTMRQLADTYKSDAERIKASHYDAE